MNFLEIAPKPRRRRLLRIRAAHAKEVGVKDPAEETSAARILLLFSIGSPCSQIDALRCLVRIPTLRPSDFAAQFCAHAGRANINAGCGLSRGQRPSRGDA